MDYRKTVLRGGVLAAAFAAIVAVSQPASAITCGQVTYTLTPNGGEICGADQNPDYSVGPDGLAQQVFAFPDMQPMTFTLSAKTDGSDGTGLITFTDAPSAGEPSPGTWAISNPKGSTVVIVLKQASSYAAFLLTGTSGQWTTTGPGGASMDLSHADIWYKPGGGSADVPLPASLPLLLAALGGAGLLTRKRRAS